MQETPRGPSNQQQRPRRHRPRRGRHRQAPPQQQRPHTAPQAPSPPQQTSPPVQHPADRRRQRQKIDRQPHRLSIHPVRPAQMAAQTRVERKAPVAVVDGSNVAYAELSPEGKPRVSNISDMAVLLQKKGYDTIIIVDASLRHQVDDQKRFDAMVRDQLVRQAPADTDADFFVIKIAEQTDAVIVTNDQYETYREHHPLVRERRIPFMIVKGQIELYEKMKSDRGERGKRKR